MATILFYSPFYRRARDVESLMISFKAEGHSVISLSQREAVEFNPYLQAHGIEAYSYLVSGGGLVYFARHLLYFIKFCKKRKVDYVFSHLDPANFVASMGQYLIRAKVFLSRHHIDEAALYNYHLSITYRITNLLARKIIVVSNSAMEYMVKVEKVSPKKLVHINLSYDFSLFKMPDEVERSKVRNEFGGGLLLLTVCRLTKYKRAELSIDVVSRLRDRGVSVKLLILGEGDTKDQLGELISERNLQGSVFLLGHVSNVLDYMAAADFIVHPSVLESSCVVIKEAGLIKKPVIVCKSVGDFDDYIRDGVNGFLVDKDEFVENATEIIYNNYNKIDKLKEMGRRLNDDVRRSFDVRNVITQFRSIM